jgi:hypothetical protein
VDCGLRLQDDVIDAKAYQLGHPKPGGEGDMQQGAVAHAITRTWIRGVEEGLHLLPREIRDELLLAFLHWNGKHTANLLQARWCAVLNEPSEGSDGCETRVAGAC